MRKESIKILEIIGIISSIIISLFSLYLSSWIWTRQVEISEQARKFELIKFFEDKRQWSKELINDIYDRLFQQWSSLNETREKIKTWSNIDKPDDIQRFVDELEYLGDLYCDWYIHKNDITTVFKKTILNSACYNKQILSEYRWYKNGFSLLCSLYQDDNKEWMWNYYDIKSCIELEDQFEKIRKLYDDVWISDYSKKSRILIIKNWNSK